MGAPSAKADGHVTKSVTLLGLGAAALAHTGLCFVPSGPASSSFFRFDVLVTVHLYDPL